MKAKIGDVGMVGWMNGNGVVGATCKKNCCIYLHHPNLFLPNLKEVVGWMKAKIGDLVGATLKKLHLCMYVTI